MKLYQFCIIDNSINESAKNIFNSNGIILAPQLIRAWSVEEVSYLIHKEDFKNLIGYQPDFDSGNIEILIKEWGK